MLIATNLLNLRILHIKSCQRITDSGIGLLASGCRLLQDISLHLCPNISSKSIHLAIVACSELRRMSFLQTRRDGDLRFPQAANQYFSQLEVVELFLPDDAGVIIATLASSCLRLRELRVFAVIDQPLDVSTLDLESCPAMPALVSLTLAGFNIKMTSFAEFLLKASQVENLSLQHCDLAGATRDLLSLSFPKCVFTGFTFDFWQFVGDSETEGRPSGAIQAAPMDLSSTSIIENFDLCRGGFARLCCNHKGVPAAARHALVGSIGAVK
eukprot:SM000065S20265  [mRNA]  locus=s65:612794:613688:+ [translate_table: standard]